MRLGPALVVVMILAAAPGAASAAGPVGQATQLAGTAGCLVDNPAATGCGDGRALSGTFGGALTPDGRFLIVASSISDAAAVLQRDAATGALTQSAGLPGCVADDPNVVAPPCRDGQNLDAARSVAVTPDGRFAYVVGGAGVSGHAIDATTGQLDPIAPGGCVSGTGNPTGGTPGACVNGRVISNASSAVVSPDGRHLYVGRRGGVDADDAIAILAIDGEGRLTQPAGAAGCLRQDGSAGAIEDQDGTDVTQGCATSTIRGLQDPNALAITPDGLTLYVANNHGVVVLRRDPATGALTQPAGTAGCITSAPIATCADGRALDVSVAVALSPTGSDVYVASYDMNAVAHFTAAADGSLTQAADTSGCIAQTSPLSDGPGLPCAFARAIGQPREVHVTPDGRGVLVTGLPGGEKQLTMLDIGAGGALSQTSEARGCISRDGTATGGAPTADQCLVGRGDFAGSDVVTSADGATIYAVAENGAAVYRREVAPRCSDAATSLTAGGSVLVPFSCSDANGDALTLAISGAPAAGTAAVEGTAVRYGAPCGTSGPQTFQVVASDGVNASPAAVGTVSVSDCNPIAPPELPLGAAPLPRLTPTTVRPDAKGRISLKLACAKTAPVRCAGRLVLKTTAVRTSRRSKRRKVLTVVRSRSYAISAGRTATVRVKLPKSVTTALRLTKGKLSLRATLTAPAQGRYTRTSAIRKLTLRARKAARR